MIHIYISSAMVKSIYEYIPSYLFNARVWSSGICGGQSGTGAGFVRVLRFPLPIFIPSNSPSS
jgi:hypothetical protein